MRLVPVTNTQKTSGPRLHYKAFVGAKPARSRRRIGNMSECDASQRPSEPEWAAFAAIDWADQKNFWRLLPAGSRTVRSRGIGEHAGSRGGLGGGLAAAFWRPAHRRVFWSSLAGPWCICSPSTRTWCCSRSTPPPRRVTGRPSLLPAPRTIPATRPSLLDLLLRHRERLRPLQPDTRGNPSVAFPGGGRASNGG